MPIGERSGRHSAPHCKSDRKRSADKLGHRALAQLPPPVCQTRHYSPVSVDSYFVVAKDVTTVAVADGPALRYLLQRVTICVDTPAPTRLTDRICTVTRLPGLQLLTVKRWVSPTLIQLDHDRPILDRYSFRTIGLP